MEGISIHEDGAVRHCLGHVLRLHGFGRQGGTRVARKDWQEERLQRRIEGTG